MTKSATAKDRTKVVPVVLCGGSGTRLWPISRTDYPKQFHPFGLEGHSLYQQVLTRLMGLRDDESIVSTPIVVTNDANRFLSTQQAREIGLADVFLLIEPVARNTAPAVTFAALHALSNEDDPVLVISPSDHHVDNPDAFSNAISKAISVASGGKVVTLGIPPERPETGFGYMSCGKMVSDDFEHVIIDHFVEKPNRTKASEYLATGSYFWNSGCFIVLASTWISIVHENAPEVLEHTKAAWSLREQADCYTRLDENDYALNPSVSVDVAVLEKCAHSGDGVAMVPLRAGWDDLGTWDAVWRHNEKDAFGNVTQGDVHTYQTENSLVIANKRLVSLAGVRDVVVVETDDAVLVSARDASGGISKVVQDLSDESREETISHLRVRRPWGSYHVLDHRDGTKVKRIEVSPGGRLSLQKHLHRSEHWLVVRGSAEVICGETTLSLGVGQSVTIPVGELHRLINPTREPLEIIEVQSGDYLGEDDIIRYDDQYGRVTR